MNQFMDISESGLFVPAVLVATIGYFGYFYFSQSELFKKMIRVSLGETRLVLFQRLLGVLILGIVPLGIIEISETKSLAQFGVVSPVFESWLWISILSIVILIINWINAPTHSNLEMYPQIRKREWSISILIVSALSWIVYLLAYEFLFRGLLFFSSIPLMGLWPAIALNIVIYMLVHLPKGWKETIGAVPLGIVLCILTYRTGSIWVAVLTHIVMALSNEWLSLRAHPEIIFKIRSK
jgi:membrane protease YdiL (CAAX protease family)